MQHLCRSASRQDGATSANCVAVEYVAFTSEGQKRRSFHFRRAEEAEEGAASRGRPRVSRGGNEMAAGRHADVKQFRTWTLKMARFQGWEESRTERSASDSVSRGGSEMEAGRRRPLTEPKSGSRSKDHWYGSSSAPLHPCTRKHYIDMQYSVSSCGARRPASRSQCCPLWAGAWFSANSRQPAKTLIHPARQCVAWRARHWWPS